MDGHGSFGQLVATMAAQTLPCPETNGVSSFGVSSGGRRMRRSEAAAGVCEELF